MQVKETNLYHSLIIDTIKAMVRLADEEEVTAKQELNGVTVLVNGDSDADLIFRDQQRAQSGYVEGEVGPYPTESLSEEELANDARIAAENEKRAEERRAQWAAEAKVKRDAFEAKLATAPEMEFSDPEGWAKFVENNSKDPYSNGVVVFSERWARLMQQEMENGSKLEDIAQSTSSEADVDGITGFMYGCAVNVLSHCWKHGEQLRRWHNLDTQLGDEGERANESGGVLNPALLSVG